VNLETKACTCLDCTEGGFTCKHYYAASIVHQRDVLPDGTMIETRSVTFTEKKVYKQDWTAYNRAQSVEKDRLQVLLHNLCGGVPDPERKPRPGQQPHTFKDSVFVIVLKVYTTFSSRRCSSDLREAHRRGFITTAMPGSKTAAFMENPAFTPILKALVAKSATPLRGVEEKFAIDSSGFSTCKFERWYDIKDGVTKKRHVWVKCHIATGVKTNVVTAIRILDKDAADCPQFVPLVKDTRKEFTISEVSADKAYLSVEKFEAVADMGGTALIQFKNNSTGAAGGIFEKMYHYFKFNQEEYAVRYHLRSNVESTFSMVKRKFGDAVRSRNGVAMVNEVLCKFLCHNLCCLIQEQCELGIEPVFWNGDESARLAVSAGA
jgi:transposase